MVTSSHSLLVGGLQWEDYSVLEWRNGGPSIQGSSQTAHRGINKASSRKGNHTGMKKSNRWRSTGKEERRCSRQKEKKPCERGASYSSVVPRCDTRVHRNRILKALEVTKHRNLGLGS